MYSTSEFDELFQILNSIKEFKLNNHKGATQHGGPTKIHSCCVAPLWLLSLNSFIEFRIWNNSSSSDMLHIQASISISPKYESKSKTTSHCHLLLHDCTNVAV